MQNNVRKLTEGAVMIALIGILVLTNRYYGTLLEGFFPFVVPLPFVLYAAKYGYKDVVVVMISAILLTAILAPLTTLFIVTAGVITGVVFGCGVYYRWSSWSLLLITFCATAFSYSVTMVLFASAFGYNLNTEITEITKVLVQAKLTLPGNLSIEAFIRRVFPLAILFSALFEAGLVYALAILLLKRLRIYVDVIQISSDWRVPKWVGYIMIGICLTNPLAMIIGVDGGIKDIVYSSSLICLFIFFVFGILMAFWFIRKYGKRNHIFIFYLLLFLLPTATIPVLSVFGAFDMCTNFREMIVNMRNNVS